MTTHMNSFQPKKLPLTTKTQKGYQNLYKNCQKRQTRENSLKFFLKKKLLNINEKVENAPKQSITS